MSYFSIKDRLFEQPEFSKLKVQKLKFKVVEQDFIKSSSINFSLFTLLIMHLLIHNVKPQSGRVGKPYGPAERQKLPRPRRKH